MNLTIMAYNIERGFHRRDHTLEQQRLEAAQHTVKLVNPDLLALTEACYGGPNAQNIVMDYAYLFGFPYTHFGSFPKFGPRGGDEGGNCLLSRFPLQAETVQLAHKSAVRARVALEDKVLTIDVIHPSPSVTDAEKIKTHAHLIQSRQAPYILAGDFNTISPEDVTKYDFNQLTKDIEAYNPTKAELIINNWQNAEFVKWLIGLGLKDAFPRETRRSTVPTSYAFGEEEFGKKNFWQNKYQNNPNRTKNSAISPPLENFAHQKLNYAKFSEAKTGVRMDFIFTSPDIRTNKTYVLKNEDTEIASDHYPIVGIFDI